MSETSHTSVPISQFAQELADARCGSDEELGRLIEKFRGYLLAVAGDGLDDALRVKVAPSDVVQETMLQAQRHFGQFRGDNSRELLSWLREILTNNVLQAARMYRVSEKRRLSREQPIATGDSRRIDPVMRDPSPTPRTVLSAREESRVLKEAVDQLPGDYRQVVLLRNWEELPFEEIGRRIDRSPEAARKLWMRAIRQLRAIFDAEINMPRVSRPAAKTEPDLSEASLSAASSI